MLAPAALGAGSAPAPRHPRSLVRALAGEPRRRTGPAGRLGARGLVGAAAVAAAQGARRRRPVRLGEVGPRLEVPEHIARPPYLDAGQPRAADGSIRHPYQFDFDQLLRIERKSPEQVSRMREAGALAREALEVAGRAVAPGVTTEEIDRVVHEFIISRGAYPSPLGYMGFPKACCTSVNEVIGHGVPDSRPLEDGDTLNVDVTVYLNGVHGDTSSMFFAGCPTSEALALCRAGQRAMLEGIRVCGPGVDFREIGRAIEEVATSAGCYPSHALSGHGIGEYFHGAPIIIHGENDLPQGCMEPGMTFTVEPVLVEGGETEFEKDEDGWTLRTRTGALGVQFEHTVLVTEDGHELLTGPCVDYEQVAAERWPPAAPPAAAAPAAEPPSPWPW